MMLAFARAHLFGYHARLMTKHDVHSLARLGAAARIKELQAEIASLRRAFPDSVGILINEKKARRPRTVSAAARAKKSAAQKARWAKRKAKK
jgi:hypothetical protein